MIERHGKSHGLDHHFWGGGSLQMFPWIFPSLGESDWDMDMDQVWKTEKRNGNMGKDSWNETEKYD